MWSLPPCHVILTNRSTSEGQLAFHPGVARDPSGAFSHVEPPKQSKFRPGMLLCGFSNKRWKGRDECLSIAAVLRPGQPRSGRGLNKIRTFRCTGSKAETSKMTRGMPGGYSLAIRMVESTWFEIAEVPTKTCTVQHVRGTPLHRFRGLVQSHLLQQNLRSKGRHA